MKSIAYAVFLMASGTVNAWESAKTTTFDRPWADAPVALEETGVGLSFTVDVSRVDQEIVGFGTAVSELSWDSLSLLSETERKKVLDELFSPDGGNFTVVRTPIGASDFALDYYSYDDHPGDFRMKKFSIAHDEQTLLPLLREIVKRVPAEQLKVWASPWCPPRWMKRTGCYASCPPWDGGAPNDCTGRERVYEGEDAFICDEDHFRAYALYFRKYVDAYRAAGVPIWMVMPQNEFNSDQPYPSCTWTAKQMATFIGGYLGPALEGSGTELFLGTLERATLEIVNTILDDRECASYVKGAGFQWAGRKAIAAVRARRPQLFLMQTEQECGDGKNDWRHAWHCWELMKHYLGNGASIYEYWNLSLRDDAKSRWGWRQNSLVSVSPATGKWRFNIEYYILKHLSHYVRRGAKRLVTEGSYTEVLAFVNPDKSVVVMMANKESAPKTVHVSVGEKTYGVTLPASSVATLRF